MFGYLLLSLISLSDAEIADSILKKADRFRTPEGVFETLVEVTDAKGSISAYEVFTEGNEKSIIVTTNPPKDRGRNILMLDREMWIFIPNINRAVRISLKQRLFGEVALGDIARMKWYGDYRPTIVVDKRAPIHLDLQAQKPDLTYDRISLWVDPTDYHPLRAEYLASSGKVLKRAEFLDYGPLGGANRPRKIRIQDALKADEISTIWLKEMKILTLPKGFFTQANLEKPRIK
jgi:outer membrane lipoprotein-sorting protein